MADIKILVADDEVTVRTFIKTVVAKERLPVAACLEAVHGLEAVRLAGEHRPGLVFLDIRMPGLGGMDVLAEIRKTAPSLVVIMLTNFPFLAYRVKSTDLGANFFFDKNSEFMKVIEVLDRMARGRRAKEPGIGEERHA